MSGRATAACSSSASRSRFETASGAPSPTAHTSRTKLARWSRGVERRQTRDARLLATLQGVEPTGVKGALALVGHGALEVGAAAGEVGLDLSRRRASALATSSTKARSASRSCSTMPAERRR